MGNLDFFPPERITDQYLWSQNIKVISAGLIKRKAVFMLVQINTKVWSMLNLNLIKTMEILVFAKLNSKLGGKGHLARFWEHHVAGWTENTMCIAASCFFSILWVSLKREEKNYPRNLEILKRQMWAFQTPINEVFCFGSIWSFTWHFIHLYFKGMTMNQVTCSGSHALPFCCLGLSPSRSMEPPGSPWELCACISSGGIQSKMRNRPGDCNGSLSRLCSIILHTIVSPYVTFFLLPTEIS